MLKKSQAMHWATKLLLSVLSIVVAVTLILAFFFVSVFWMIGLEYEAENVAGPAPEGDYHVRRKWGEQHLGKYLASAESWIKKSEKIEKHIGEISGVAPIGRPNKHGASFGESWTNLHLQVIGSRGEGFLRLDEYNWNGRSGQADWQEEYWSRNGQTTPGDSVLNR